MRLPRMNTRKDQNCFHFLLYCAVVFILQRFLFLVQDLLHQLNLYLLQFKHALPELQIDVVNFFVKLPDLKFGFQVDLVVILRPQAVLGLLSILAHHDHGGLQRGNAGKNQVHQDKGVGIKRVSDQNV